jgi:thioredoxin 1
MPDIAILKSGRNPISIILKSEGTMSFEQITNENFEQEVIKSATPILVEFGAVWCAPCKRLEPEMEKLKAAWGEKIRLGKIDVDSSSDLAVQFSVMSVPTVILFVDGKERQRLIGFVPLAKMIDKFQPHL